MADENARLEIICPGCQTKLTIDAKSGLILHVTEKKSAYSFEEAVQQVKRRKEMADDLFQKAFSEEKKRKDTLEEKFQQALEMKDELDEPSRPWDMD